VWGVRKVHGGFSGGLGFLLKTVRLLTLARIGVMDGGWGRPGRLPLILFMGCFSAGPSLLRPRRVFLSAVITTQWPFFGFRHVGAVFDFYPTFWSDSRGGDKGRFGVPGREAPTFFAWIAG
jgi:hypothetical protein